MFDVIISSILLVLVRVFYDAKYLNYHKSEHVLLLTCEFLLIQLVGLVNGVWFSPLVYAGVRFLLFDPFFGKVFKDDWRYLGSTSKWDKFRLKLRNMSNKQKFLLTAIVYLVSIMVLHFIDFNVDTLWGSIFAGFGWLTYGALVWYYIYKYL